MPYSIQARHIMAMILILAFLAAPAVSVAQVSVSVTIAPPVLPIYEQPEPPAPGYIWTPGYWDYGPDGYFWVPGTWIEPPEPGLLWTPGYWGWSDGVFLWNAGYWGPHIGFYGGVNYGFGYTGHGYQGGYWQNNQFFYNQAVTKVNVTMVHNVYSTTVVNNVTTNNVSFNGGPGGVKSQPTAEEQVAAHEAHRGPTSSQIQQRQSASANRELLASVNHGKPTIAATSRPGERLETGAAKTGDRASAPSIGAVPRNAAPTGPAGEAHANVPPSQTSAAKASAGTEGSDQSHQQQNAQVQAKHDQERQASARKKVQQPPQRHAPNKAPPPVDR